jgi:hypothetical protein
MSPSPSLTESTYEAKQLKDLLGEARALLAVVALGDHDFLLRSKARMAVKKIEAALLSEDRS